MKKVLTIIISYLLINNFANAYDYEGYGTYYNERTKVKIFYEMGGRGGDEFSSSVCPKKIFKPPYIDDLYWDQEAKKNQKPYSILITPVRMTLDSEERCLPDGNYKKISDDIKK